MGLLLESKLDSARIPAVDWTIHVQKFGQSLLALNVEEEWQKSCPSLASQWQLVQQIDLHQHLQKYSSLEHCQGSNKLKEIPELHLGHQ